MQIIGPKIEVPANASRLFKTHNEAVSQPIASVQLAISIENPFIFNLSFSPTEVIYDFNYCTVEPFHFKQSLSYFDEILEFTSKFDVFIEIGCGQGEFVRFLTSKGITAYGFDPVLRNPNDFLFDELWSIENEQHLINYAPGSRIMYVMRCVLPHIQEPFTFLDRIFENSPKAGVLLEFQRREWIENYNVWTQISHDHVNIFSAEDFSRRYEVVTKINFSNDEWVYILITQKNEGESSNLLTLPSYTGFDKLFSIRENEISLLSSSGRSIAVYGAAGKGIVLAFSLKKAGVRDLVAIDSDPSRRNLFMEASGIKIVESEKLKEELESKPLILVANPNHFSYVSGLFYNQDVLCIGRVGEVLA